MDDVSGGASGILFAFNVCEQDSEEYMIRSEDHASNDDRSSGQAVRVVRTSIGGLLGTRGV